jgi:hypothetical protein
VSAPSPITPAPRYDRRRFVALGLLPLLNAVWLPLYTLAFASHGDALSGANREVALLVMMALSVLIAMPAVVRRGRDLGWRGGKGVIAFVAGWMLPPVALGLLLYLALAGSKPGGDHFGPAPGPAPMLVYIRSIVIVATPWAVIAVLNTL